VEKEPQSWALWMRLGMAYDACGDRRRARWAIRRAITIEKASA
jgi:Flp pilus assembly protein TadD